MLTTRSCPSGEVDLRPLGDELGRLHDPLDRAFDVLFPDLVAFVAGRARDMPGGQHRESR